jgi:hypothetical protein
VISACGSVISAYGSVISACGSVISACGSVISAYGSVISASGSVISAYGRVISAYGSVIRAWERFIRVCRCDLLCPPCGLGGGVAEALPLCGKAGDRGRVSKVSVNDYVLEIAPPSLLLCCACRGSTALPSDNTRCEVV